MKRTLLVVGLILGLALIFAACAPKAAPVEPTAVPATEVPPAPTEDPAVAIAAEFAASGHADATGEAFVHWDAETEIPVGCAKCHSEAGFVEYAGTGAIAAGIPVPGKPFSCATCHNDAADALTSVTFPSGAVIENLGPEARCLTCHQGRESKISVDAKIAKYGENLDPDAIPAPLAPATPDGKPVALSFSNVHYFAAGGTLYGSMVKMGYEYDGKVYDVKSSHVAGYDTCIGCHDQHSLEVKVEECAHCHEGVAAVEDLQNVREPSSSKDYDGDGDKEEGVAKEIEGLQAILLSSIQNYALEVSGAELKYDPAAYPYFMGADGKSYTSWTPRLLKAAYNYQVSIKDPGAFAHGGKYIIELLFDSIEDVNSSEKLTTKFDVSTLTREDSGHFTGATEAWRHWDAATETKPAYEVEAGCATCHSAYGLPQVIKGEEVTAAMAGNGLMCQTCHDVTAFPAVFAQKDVTIPSGKTISYGDGAASNICINCHSSRTGKVTIDKMITDFAVTDLDAVVAPVTINDKEVKFSFKNSHYQGVAGQWFGTDAQVAYEYEGKTYAGTNTHPAVNGKPGCVGCHDAHTGELELASCTTCHAGVDDFDAIRMYPTDWNGNGDTTEGVRNEYTPVRDALYAAIQAYAKDTVGTAIVYDREAYPYWFTDANGDGKHDADEKAYTTWTARLMKAAYNFNWLRKTSGGFAHNFKYVFQIAYDSAEDLGADVTMFTRP